MLSPRQGWTGSPHSLLFTMERKKKGVGGPIAVGLSNLLLPQRKEKTSEKQSDDSVTPAAVGGCSAAAVKPKVEQL